MAPRNIEDIYPLSPMQKGMMFHSLAEPGLGVYVEQTRIQISGVDVDTFRQAWERIVARHAALRTSVVGTGRKEPVQVVRKHVDLPWTEYDGRSMSADQQESWIAEFLRQDRERSFRLDEPTLIRLTFLRTGESAGELVWTLHHIALDGWSGPLVLRDVVRTYDALRNGVEPELVPVRPFRDYIQWLQGQDLSRAEAYWRARLAGFTQPTVLAADRGGSTGPAVVDYREDHLNLTVEQTAAIRRLASESRVTPNIVVQAAWSLLLGRYSGEDDVVFGVVVSCRPDDIPGADTMVGMFVNTLPFRASLPPEATIGTWLKSIQGDLAEQRQYEYSPLWEVQRWAAVAPGTPLFESVYVFENQPVTGADVRAGSSLTMRMRPMPSRIGYPLMLLVVPTDELRLAVTYDAARFEGDTVRRLLGHLRRVLVQMAADPNARLSDINLLDGEERGRVVVEWNRTEKDYPTDACLHQLFERCVDEHPDDLALIAGDARLTYRQLDVEANRLAAHLRGLGVGPDVPVALCLARSPEMVTAILAVLKAGGAYLPLDPAYPADRLAYLLQNARAAVVITREGPGGGLQFPEGDDGTPTVVRLDLDAGAIASCSSERPASGVRPEHLAYLLYTSGSTGRPKGVAMPHAPLVNLMHWQFQRSAVGRGSRTLHFAPFSFDVSCQEVFATLGSGGTLVLATEDERLDPEALLELIRSECVERAFMPYVALQHLCEVAIKAGRVPEQLSEVITAGEQLQITPAVAAFFERIPGSTLDNQYGPTECHVVSALRLSGNPREWPLLPGIGRPISNVRLYILDNRLQPVPVGVPGELYIGGKALARGYLYDDDLTARRFVRDPFADDEDARMYRTGDLTSFESDGEIRFLGRIDDQVKLRGFRVELGEVESRLSEHPDVRQAVAVIREDRPGDRRLVAYILPQPSRVITAGELRQFLAERVPEYMIPAAFSVVSEVPLTPSGKVHRKALEAAEYAPLEMRDHYVAPRGPLEEALVGIWSEILGVHDPGIHDDFFQLGGHSLMATQLVSRVRDALKVELPLRALFDRPTVAKLAAEIERLRREGASVPDLVPRPRGATLELSPGQQRLWVLDQMGSAGAYNIHRAYRLSGTLDRDSLEGSLRDLTRRHEALRTRFVVRDGQPCQVIDENVDLTLEVSDLSSVRRSERDLAIQALIDRDAGKAFDLTVGPLIRARLIELGSDEYVLLLSMHHIVCDGWSMGLLARDLAALYGARRTGEPPRLPELTVQYADFAVWQNERLQGELADRQLSYWKDKLGKGLPVLNLPTDRPRPPVQTFRGASHRLALSRELSDAVSRLARKEGVTVAMVLLAAYQALLSRYTGQEDIVVGSPIANRTRSEIEDLIGFFVNSVVLRADLSGNPTFSEVLRRVQQLSLDAYDHQDLPFERLVHELNPERDLARTPLYQTVFAMQNVPRIELQLPGVVIGDYPVEAHTARFDLELYLHEHPTGIRGVFSYNVDLFDASTVERMAAHLTTLLEGAVSNPETRLSELPLLDPGHRDRAIVEWNETRTAYPRDKTVDRLFEEHVERTPAAAAVAFEDQTLSYQELNARANQLAHYLRKRGVGPEVLVGIFVERSLDMVVGLLGVLKAGGAYVPLDLTEPADRIAFVLEDTAVRVLITGRDHLDNLPEHAAEVICLDRDGSDIDKESEANPGSGVDPDNLAYVIYTSGSTGRPKGVQIEHRQLLNYTLGVLDLLKLPQGAHFATVSTLAADLGNTPIFGALCSGGCLHVMSEERIRNGGAFAEYMKAKAVDCVKIVPSHLEALLAAAANPADVLPRRMLVVGGEICSWALVERVQHLSRSCAIVNEYGPTETTVGVVSHRVRLSERERFPWGPPVGRPNANTQVYILDPQQQPVPIGIPGELYIGGEGVARGYLSRPEQTAEKFVPDPFRSEPDARLYRTGDLARYRADGNIEFMGRIDHQVKLRGFRIELGEIESVLVEQPDIEQAAAMVCGEGDGRHLVAYVVERARGEATPARLREFLRRRLPEYMVPSAFVILDALPLTPNGKVDRRALPAPVVGRPSEQAYVAPRSEIEEKIAAIWRSVLGVESVGARDNFFDLGGHSLRLLQVHRRLVEELGRDLPVTDLFEYPTVEGLANHLSGKRDTAPGLHTSAKSRLARRGAAHGNAVAVIAMAGRFPGAADVERFWENLRDGVECVRSFTDEELRAAGLPEHLVTHPRFVRTRAVLDDIDLFDARFFGYSPREAELMDPQQRVFLECSWEVLERAGYDPGRYEGMIAVYAGMNTSSYVMNLQSQPELMSSAGGMQSSLSVDKDYLATRVSYDLNLRGPSMTVQTACSTSLVAVHEACRSLLDHGCDIALAGGVCIGVPVVNGVVYEPGGILSADGHNRTFDARADGTVASSGSAVVALKRLEDALADGDQIHAVIRGTAVNNDGSAKVGFTAPSVEGQAAVIALAQASAGVDPESISYVEAHGTATALGDPIEVAALTKVFRERTAKRAFCGLGSLKSNMGHLSEAAGVAGLIKTVLAMEHGQLPPSLHFDNPNPNIDFDDSPFYVVSELRDWTTPSGVPRRAGVSAFGLGGTNAHAILEEAPALDATGPSRPCQLLMLSAKSREALDVAATSLASHLEGHSDLNLADVAYTLQVGRGEFRHRRAVLCRDASEAVQALRGGAAERVWTRHAPERAPSVVFMFPGHGHQHMDMGRELYETEAVFRDVVDEGLEYLRDELDFDLQGFLYPAEADSADPAAVLDRPTIFQPALFLVDYAMAKLWQSWGVEPVACIGHSLGEYVAACVSGVLSYRDALRIVSLRGRLMEKSPDGAMLSIPFDEDHVRALLENEEGIWLSAVNAPSLCLVSGDPTRIAVFEERLTRDGVECSRVAATHAYHSGLMEGGVRPLVDAVGKAALGSLGIPFMSNLTGDWITESEARSPEYWGLHLREPVRFAEGMERILKMPDQILLEIGPGQIMTSLARMHDACDPGRVLISSMRHPKAEVSDAAVVMGAVARLWTAGGRLSWPGFYRDESRRRVTLPTYPFQRQRFWIDRVRKPVERVAGSLGPRRNIADWYYTRFWRRTSLSEGGPSTASDRGAEARCVVFGDGSDFARRCVERLKADGRQVFEVTTGARYERTGDRITLDPRSQADYQRLVGDLARDDGCPGLAVHLWGTTPAPASLRQEDALVDEVQYRGYFSLFFLVRALADAEASNGLRIFAVTEGVHDVTGAESICAEKATVLGAVRVIDHEFTKVSCRNVDFSADDLQRRAPDAVDALIREIDGAAADTDSDAVVAYRNGRRWVESFSPVRLVEPKGDSTARLRERGTYLVTGGLTGVGLVLANCLAEWCHANLVLVGRTPLPDRSEWAEYLRGDGNDESVSRRIRAVQSLEASGAQVMACAADVSDPVEMQKVLKDARTHFGPIHGVVHAAGVTAGGLMAIQSPDRPWFSFGPKLMGARVLERSLSQERLDFFVVCSSLNTVIGVPGVADYSAANAYLDAFARCHAASTGRFCVSVNWSRWREVGMAVEAAGAPLPEGQGISNQEGGEVFRRILRGAEEPNVLVSETDLPLLLRSARSQRYQLPAGSESTDKQERETAEAPSGRHLYPRPELPTDFVPPETQTELALAEIWSAVLGIDGIGVNDNFLELGGSSLVAIKVLSRVRETLKVELQLHKLFLMLTIGELAKHIDGLMWAKEGQSCATVGESESREEGTL